MAQQSYVLNILQGDKVEDTTEYFSALPVNMSGVVKPILGAQGFMRQENGLTAFGTATPGTDRAGVWNDRFNAHYRVSGGSLISVTADGIPATLGAITGSSQVSMPYSFNTQAVIGDGKYYLYDPTNGFRQVTDPDLGAPIDGVWVDGYYFMTDGQFLFHTDLTDESAIDPLKFATSEFSPDGTVGVGLTVDNKVLAFNRNTTECFQNQASANFAFTRIPSRNVTAGIVGTHAKVRIDADTPFGTGTWFCLGGGADTTPTVYALSVGSTTSISNREIDNIIGQYSEAQLATAILETRTVDKYVYLLVHLPNDVLQFSFEVAKAVGPEGAWTILKSDVSGNIPYRAVNGIFEPRIAAWIYGDKYTNILGKLDETVATQYGEIAEWLLFTPFLPIETASIDEFSVQTVPGFTTTLDANVFLSLTYDGAFYSMETTMEYGAPSQYNKRFIARRLGYVRNYFALKLRGASRSRMAFATALLLYG